MAFEFSISRRVQFAETDMAGVVHFSNYFRWMEEVEHAFFRSVGLSVVMQHQGRDISWRLAPRDNVRDRVVLVVDDILDEGITLAAIRKKLLEMGAREVLSAVFADKDIGRAKPVTADFVGVRVPNRYVFGFGMDAYGLWRNLPSIYALKET